MADDALRIVVLEGDETGQELLEQAIRVLDPELLGLGGLELESNPGTAATLYAAPEAAADETDDEYDDAESV